MCKRLAQLNAEIDHNHGTSMSALRFRGLVEDGPVKEMRNETHGFTYRRSDPCCLLTDAGREALAEARREGW